MINRFDKHKAVIDSLVAHLPVGVVVGEQGRESIKWLVSQAEMLQSIVPTREYVNSLEGDVRRLNHRTKALEENLKVKEKSEDIYREALEFYADEDNHGYEVTYDMSDVIESEVMEDYGRKAKEALNEGKDDSEYYWRGRYKSTCPECQNEDILTKRETNHKVHCQRCYYHYDYIQEGIFNEER